MDYLRFALIACLALGASANVESSAGVQSADATPAAVAEPPVHAETAPGTTPPANAQPESHIQVIKMKLSEAEVQELLALEAEIAKETEELKEGTDGTVASDRNGRSVKNKKLSEAAAALTDDEINEILKMISFPPDAKDEIVEDKEAYHTTTVASPTRHRDAAEIEPRVGARSARAARSRGYYILAFEPIEGPLRPLTVPYSKLEIIPAERSLDGEDDLEPAASDVDESRLLSMHQVNKYLRRMMRQIRKGTRFIQRKTRFKSHAQEPQTVENFLQKLYHTRQKQIKPSSSSSSSSWFSW